MKKNLKKFIALLVSVMMVLAVAVVANATEAGNSNNLTGNPTSVAVAEKNITKGKLTINGRAGAEYNVYPVFSAEIKEGDATYTWTAVPEYDEGLLTNVSAEEIVGYSKEELKAFAGGLEGSKSKPNPVENLNEIPLGYYLVVDDKPEGLEKTQPILVAIPQVQETEGNQSWVYDITVTPKSSQTDFYKKIEEGGKLVDTNSKNIGEYVNYRLWADIPTYAEEAYENDAPNITFEITDNMSDALTWGSESEVKVYVLKSYGEDFNNPTDLTQQSPVDKQDNYTLTGSVIGENPVERGGNFTVSFTRTFLHQNKGNVVVVAFSAMLNENAAIAGSVDADGKEITGKEIAGYDKVKDADYNRKGNPNGATLTYTNEFDVKQGSKTNEIKDIVTTFTFKLNVDKVEKDNLQNHLSGAIFKVYQKKADGKYTKNDFTENDLYTNRVFKGSITSTEDGVVTANGFDAGTYYLIETEAPAGYKVYDGVIKVVIDEKRDAKELNGKFDYTVTMGDKESKEQAVVTVEDEKGLTLPGTGGIGTTLFTFGGLALVVLAAVLFIVYTRKQKKNS